MTAKKDITILYVDDEEINVFLFERAFNNLYNVVTANSGEEGLKALEKHSEEIIVVISDMRMPGMDGITFIRKAREKYKYISYYILTAFSHSEEINAAIEEKIINEFFTKPFNLETIKNVVDKASKEFQ